MSRRNSRPWVKLWTDCLDSRQLARAGEPAELLFYRLLSLNGTDGAGDTLHLTAADLAWRLRMDPADVDERLSALSVAGLIERKGSDIRFPAWDERQNGKTEAERAREYRDRKKSDQLQRHGSERTDRHDTERTLRDAPNVLESESESESEEEKEHPHTQPLPTPRDCNPRANGGGPVRVDPPSAPPGEQPMPPSGRRIARTTDADLEPWFAAVCSGLRQPLTYGPRYCLPTERIVAHAAKLGLSEADVKAVAGHYRAKCKDGTPSFPKFADEIDRWRADWQASKTGGQAPRKTPEQLRAAGRCPEHPGESLNGQGRCDLCDEVAAFRRRLSEPMGAAQ